MLEQQDLSLIGETQLVVVMELSEVDMHVEEQKVVNPSTSQSTRIIHLNNIEAFWLYSLFILLHYKFTVPLIILLEY
ncbi:hypothetical protein Tco_1328715 [Tanacetum coccineum]